MLTRDGISKGGRSGCPIGRLEQPQHALHMSIRGVGTPHGYQLYPEKCSIRGEAPK
jgi:hypothetical protein